MIGTNLPKEPSTKATGADGRPLTSPDNSADIYASISITSAGVYMSVWSLKARVWVRLLNRYQTVAAALGAIEGYGWVHWDMAVPPYSRDQRRQKMEQARGDRR